MEGIEEVDSDRGESAMKASARQRTALTPIFFAALRSLTTSENGTPRGRVSDVPSSLSGSDVPLRQPSMATAQRARIGSSSGSSSSSDSSKSSDDETSDTDDTVLTGDGGRGGGGAGPPRAC